ncbi:class I SAM-dependent methyltransferase [Primorskyibacter sp. 2E107]|uniref:class I SAM-dependent methyltransferase n=1 Tax=Primorskyibacter sp. 2E107 TaxID=3403458 RepID=UPI003AF557D7
MSHAGDHGALMDEVYRRQRRIYDVTRKYYLLGRDHLIEQMDVQSGQSVLEVACGTGRNLAAMRQRYPQARLFGLDISEQMLLSARAKLGSEAALARADACKFDPETLLGVDHFDHIVFSYSLSMIPDWQSALSEALRHLAPGGTLHLVDFGDQSALPRWFRRGLLMWLAKFHVTPRPDLPDVMRRHAGADDGLRQDALYRGYATYARLSRRSAA